MKSLHAHRAATKRFQAEEFYKPRKKPPSEWNDFVDGLCAIAVMYAAGVIIWNVWLQCRSVNQQIVFMLLKVLVMEPNP